MCVLNLFCVFYLLVHIWSLISWVITPLQHIIKIMTSWCRLSARTKNKKSALYHTQYFSVHKWLCVCGEREKGFLFKDKYWKEVRYCSLTSSWWLSYFNAIGGHNFGEGVSHLPPVGGVKRWILLLAVWISLCLCLALFLSHSLFEKKGTKFFNIF